MNKLILTLALAVVGLLASNVKAEDIGYYTTISTGVSVSTRANVNVVGWSVSTGAGSQYFVLLDTVAFGATMGTSGNGAIAGFSGLNSYPVSRWLSPQISLISTGTANTAYQNTMWLKGDGIPVKKGLFIFGSGTGGYITVYTKPTPSGDRE